MIEYKIVIEGNQIWVKWNTEGTALSTILPYRNGPYTNEASAKRRFRDLKRKDAATELKNANDTAIAIGKLTTAAPAPAAIVRQVGVYPAVSKHSYRR